MHVARLPEDGSPQVGSLRLPEGRRTHVHGFRNGSYPPVAWVTTMPMPDPGAVWAELSQASPQTGLVPFIARPLHGAPHRPWDDGAFRYGGYFQFPADLAAADRIDVAAALRANWDEQAAFPPEDPAESGWRQREHARMIAPFFSGFPGLGPRLCPAAQPRAHERCAHLPATVEDRLDGR